MWAGFVMRMGEGDNAGGRAIYLSIYLCVCMYMPSFNTVQAYTLLVPSFDVYVSVLGGMSALSSTLPPHVSFPTDRCFCVFAGEIPPSSPIATPKIITQGDDFFIDNDDYETESEAGYA